MKIFKFLFVFVVLFSFVGKSHSQNSVRLSEISNLTYQLDCVSNQRIACSVQNLKQLWKEEFLKTDKDSAMLDEWNKLRKFNSKYINLSDQQGNRSTSLNLFEKIRIAGLQADSIDDYLSRMDLITPPQERAGFERVIRHFYPKFKAWWSKEIAEKGNKFQSEINEILQSEKVTGQINRFISFYSPSLTPNYATSFNLIYVPSAIKEATNGQQIENYSLIEFNFGEPPLQRVPVIIHELCHFYYGNIAKAKQNQLEESFNKLNNPLAVPAYNLLNESVASAFGNGMIVRELVNKERYEKYRDRKNSFYNNDAIDKTSKAVIPLLDEFMNQNKTLVDSDFVARYVAELEKIFNKDEISPRLYLFTMSLIVDGEFGKFELSSVIRELRSSSVYNSQGDLSGKEMTAEFQQAKKRNSIVIVKPKNLKTLIDQGLLNKSDVKKIERSYKKENVVLFNKQSKNYINSYIIVADDKETAVNAVKLLASTKQFVGINKELIKSSEK